MHRDGFFISSQCILNFLKREFLKHKEKKVVFSSVKVSDQLFCGEKSAKIEKIELNISFKQPIFD